MTDEGGEGSGTEANHDREHGKERGVSTTARIVLNLRVMKMNSHEKTTCNGGETISSTSERYGNF